MFSSPGTSDGRRYPASSLSGLAMASGVVADESGAPPKLLLLGGVFPNVCASCSETKVMEMASS